MRLLPALFALALAAPAPAQTVEDGFKAYDAGDYETAKSIFLPLAEAGDPRAMNTVGLMFAYGRGVEFSAATACDWFERAAELGHSRAQSNIASCFEYGRGRPQIASEAVRWATFSAEQGNVTAQVALVRLLHLDAPEDARKWGQKAADAGSVPARLMMEKFGLAYSGARPSRYQKYCFSLKV